MSLSTLVVEKYFYMLFKKYLIKKTYSSIWASQTVQPILYIRIIIFFAGEKWLMLVETNL